MNFRIVLKSLGIVLICEAICMLPSLLVAVIYGDGDTLSFLISITLLLISGFLMTLIRPKNRIIYARDGFGIVSIGWFLISLFGALPFYFSGAIPSFVDCFFETVSGFSTTGASILSQVEGLPRGILFWRSFTHWIGGMGILVLTLAVLPSVGGNIYIMQAESPGPSPGKLVPKMAQTAKIMYTMYIVLTLVLIIALLIAGMPLYDTFIHAFGTAGTGGFSNKNISVGAYNSVPIEMTLSFFMLVFGVNFTIYYTLLKGNIKSIFKDEELRLYLSVVAVAIILITLNTYGKVFGSVWEALRHSIFQVSSIITTTGYSSTDFNTWPIFSKTIIMILMLFGACAGSTAGGIKNIRIVLLFKIARRELGKVLHPKSVHTVKIGGKAVDEGILTGVEMFFFMYMAILCLATLVISIDCSDFETAASSVITTIGNVGPGLGMTGPMSNFSWYSDFSKLVFSLCMIIGRLEIYPVLLLFMPTFWKKVNI